MIPGSFVFRVTDILADVWLDFRKGRQGIIMLGLLNAFYPTW
jgi:hypothetical protein